MFFSENQYLEASEQAGFEVRERQILNITTPVPSAARRDVAFSFEIPPLWIQLVLVRP